MAHEFVILRNGILETYDKYEDIPDSFDNVIKFSPEMLDETHEQHDHEEIDFWNQKLQELLKRETN